ncbi:serine/threonine protein phosphatase [Pelomonas sp. HMWF004]|nr:serine/threonine protein phosphatase [Pelomonas sp. HMWF004]
MTHRERIARFAQLSTELALQSDQQLAQLVDGAEQLASGIGGTTLTFSLAGHQVFAKRLRLTDLELHPAHQMSTANLFGLPTYCQRNVGSAGFGAWRELAANVMTTGWVLAQQLESFPLMYHWRVLEGASSPAAAPRPVEWTDVERMTRYWGGSDAMRARLVALADAKFSLMIFLEHVPWTLHAWLERQCGAQPGAMTSALEMVERSLTVDIPLMNSLGLLHGDAHHGNILTDGQRLYFADLGLATSARFALSTDEVTYLHHNVSLDRGYALSKWVNGLVKAFAPSVDSPLERFELVRAAAQGQAMHQLFPGMPSGVAEIVHRHAPIATVINDFYVKLHGEDRRTPYPRDAVEALLEGAAR